MLPSMSVQQLHTRNLEIPDPTGNLQLGQYCLTSMGNVPMLEWNKKHPFKHKSQPQHCQSTFLAIVRRRGAERQRQGAARHTLLAWLVHSRIPEVPL